MLNLNVYKGEKKQFTFLIKDKDGNAIDLTDKQVYMRITDALPPAKFTTLATVQATDLGADGTCKITLTETETTQTPGAYFYEIYVVYPAGEEYVAEIGILQVITRTEGEEAKTYATPDEVKMKLRLDGTDFDNEEIQYFLEQAHRKVITECGSFQQYITQGNYPEVIKEYCLPHGAVMEVKRIIHNGEIVDESNYTVDYDNGVITFNSDYSINVFDTLIFHYVPYLYKDLEIAFTMKDMLSQMYMQTGGEFTNAKLQEVKEEIERIKRELNILAIGSWVDYSHRGIEYYGFRY